MTSSTDAEEMSMIGDVAAVICTRNGHSRGFLAEALRSVFEQTVAPAEIILVDDGSTDGTADEVRRAYPGVTVLSNDGSGLAAARNTGIRAARSVWIAFIDDDDVWCPNKLAEQLAQTATSTQPESTIWASRAAYIGQGRNTPAPVPLDIQFANWPACLLSNQIEPSGVMFSQALFRKIGPFNECIRFAAYDFLIRCLAAGTPVSFSEDILLHRRIGHPQMTSATGLLANLIAGDAMFLTRLKMLPPALSSRLRTARLLLGLRACAWRCGLASAKEFWRVTSLRPVRAELRAYAYLFLTSVAWKAPYAMRQRLRAAAIQFLLGHQ
jgi:hypothetical protein